MEKAGSRILPRFYPLLAFFIPVAVIVFLWLMAHGSFQKNENEDYFVFYLPVAQSIVNGNGITLNGKLAAEYPPGYPVLLAVVLFTAQILHIDQEVLFRVSIALYLAISALLIYFCARVLWSPCQAFWASVLWSFYPLIMWAAKQQNSELPFMPFLYGALLCFLVGWRAAKNKAWYFFFGGILCGAAMLIRPIAIGIGLIIAVLMLFWKRYRFSKRVVFALLIVGGNLMIVLPWEVWMWRQTHEVNLLCQTRDTNSMFDGLTFAVWNPEGYRKGVAVPADVKKFMEETIPKYFSIHSTGQIIVLVTEQLKTHPGTMIKLLCIKAARSWYGTNSNRLESLILPVQGFYFILIALACWKFWKTRADCRLPLAIGLLLLVYFWVMTISVLSIVRYMVPVLGLMFIFFPALKPSRGFSLRRYLKK
ncbi:MAG TPA: glycosyltransferase family 39 protein [Chitinivibrionales bacterium]